MSGFEHARVVEAKAAVARIMRFMFKLSRQDQLYVEDEEKNNVGKIQLTRRGKLNGQV